MSIEKANIVAALNLGLINFFQYFDLMRKAK